MKRIQEIFEEHLALHRAVMDGSLPERIGKVAEEILACFDSGGKLLIAGNGGSAADAQHFAAEMVGKFLRNRKALPALALTTDTSILTSIANDTAYSNVFVRQLEALAKPDDIFFAISTSGSSQNIIAALEWCRNNGVKTIGLTGEGGSMADFSDILLAVPSRSVPRIQEVHELTMHVLCELVEAEMTKRK